MPQGMIINVHGVIWPEAGMLNCQKSHWFYSFSLSTVLATIKCYPEESMEWITEDVFQTAPQYFAINCIIDDFIKIICPPESFLYHNKIFQYLFL